MKDEEWTMADGTKIMVEDMDERHAKNCLRLVIRRANIINKQRIESIFDDMADNLSEIRFEAYMLEEGDR